MHECVRCGGLFVAHPTLAKIVEDRERSGALPVPDARPFEFAKKPLADVDVRYVKCPLCHQQMNRANFGKRSGVVVDVCKQHGTWFDAGELTQAVEWIASGGLEPHVWQQARRDASHRDERAARIKEAQAIAQAAMMNESIRERVTKEGASR
jgi:Zn-finger nucleic acid-binding protein